MKLHKDIDWLFFSYRGLSEAYQRLPLPHFRQPARHFYFIIFQTEWISSLWSIDYSKQLLSLLSLIICFMRLHSCSYYASNAIWKTLSLFLVDKRKMISLKID